MPSFPAYQTATTVRPSAARDGVALASPATPRVVCAGLVAIAPTDSPPVLPAVLKAAAATTPITLRQMLEVMDLSPHLRPDRRQAEHWRKCPRSHGVYDNGSAIKRRPACKASAPKKSATEEVRTEEVTPKQCVVDWLVL
jgi:hypothetical protein